MNLRETAENLVEFARHSKQEELGNVVDAVVNFVREQRINILNETLQLLKEDLAHEAIISQRQRQEATKLSQRKNL
tara:strand:- start:3146 stop:3373 length:228 start_codon:yes stop_codon:yes gene_type:complete